MIALADDIVALAVDELALVLGGDSSSTQVRVPGASYETRTSDYQTCVETVTQLTRQQYPDTRWFGIFGTDRNAGPRAAATLKNLREVCGTPPQ